MRGVHDGGKNPLTMRDDVMADPGAIKPKVLDAQGRSAWGFWESRLYSGDREVEGDGGCGW